MNVYFMIEGTHFNRRRNCFNRTYYFSSKYSATLLLTELAFTCEGAPVVLMLLPLVSSHHQQSLCLCFEVTMACILPPQSLTILTIPSMHSYIAH